MDSAFAVKHGKDTDVSLLCQAVFSPFFISARLREVMCDVDGVQDMLLQNMALCHIEYLFFFFLINLFIYFYFFYFLFLNFT